MDENSDIDFSLLFRKIFRGAGFRTSSFLIVRIVQIVRIAVFARIFLPNDLGTANLALSCIGIMSIFANFGFSQSVIRNRTQTHSIDTIFTLSLFFGSTVFIITWLCAPIFSDIFSTKLDSYIHLLAILTLSVPVKFPVYLWEKELEFGNPSIVAVIGEIVLFTCAVSLEKIFHLGIWSLLFGNVANFLISGLYVWIISKFRPKILMSKEQIRPLLSFGYPLVVQGLNGEAMSRGDNLMVGAYAGTIQLAYYNFAWQLPTLISSFTQTIDSMLFPVFVKVKENKLATRRLFNLSNKMWGITGSFLGFTIFLFAEQIVDIFYGPAWKPVIPILKVMSLSFIIRYCSGYAYDNLALVTGRTKYLMKWGIVNTILIFTVGQFMISKIGPIGGAWFWMLQALLLIPLVRFPLIYQELGTLEFFKHIWQPFLSGILASMICYFSGFLLKNDNISVMLSTFILFFIYCLTYLILLVLIDNQLRKDISKMYNLIHSRNDN